MLCGRAGGQERCAFDAIVDNEDLHLVSSFDSICSRVKTPRVKKAGGSDGKGTRVRLDEIASPLRFEGLTKLHPRYFLFLFRSDQGSVGLAF